MERVVYELFYVFMSRIDGYFACSHKYGSALPSVSFSFDID